MVDGQMRLDWTEGQYQPSKLCICIGFYFVCDSWDIKLFKCQHNKSHPPLSEEDATIQ